MTFQAAGGDGSEGGSPAVEDAVGLARRMMTVGKVLMERPIPGAFFKKGGVFSAGSRG